MFKAPHNHCSDLIAPGTMVHIGSKTLHLAATNQTTGEHHNTAHVSTIEQHRMDHAPSAQQGPPTETDSSARVELLLWTMNLCKNSERSTAGKPLSKEQVFKMEVQPYRHDHPWSYRTHGPMLGTCRESSS